MKLADKARAEACLIGPVPGLAHTERVLLQVADALDKQEALLYRAREILGAHHADLSAVERSFFEKLGVAE